MKRLLWSGAKKNKKLNFLTSKKDEKGVSNVSILNHIILINTKYI